MADRTIAATQDTRVDASSEELERLLAGAAKKISRTESPSTIHGVVVGKLVALTNGGTTPLVTYRGQPGTTALAARTTVDLHGVHIGRDATLIFEDGDPLRPIVIGWVRELHSSSLRELPGNVEVDADGERLVVSAKNQMVLKCGKASITLTKAGKILISGEYVSSRSSGVNRVRGGSVELN